MTRKHWCTVGEVSVEAGYTLIELLVVLAMIALLAGAVPVALSRAKPGYDVRAATNLIADALRSTRDRAIRNDKDYVVRIDNQRKLILTVPDGLPRLFPASVNAVSDSERNSDLQSTIEIRFYSDGSTNGAVLRISTGQQHRIIAVDEVTGRVGVRASDR